MTAISAADIDTAVRALRPRLGDRLLLPDGGGFEGARRVWNAAVTRRPALIARCRDTAEVSAAVRAARDAGLPLSVRAGNLDRLLAAKRRYDPDNVFSAIPALVD